MERDYKVTINMPEDIREWYKNAHETCCNGLKWSDYISDVVNKALREMMGEQK